MTGSVARGLTAAELTAELDRIEDELSYDIESWSASAERIEREAAALDDVGLMLRARMVQADVWHRRGHIAAAAPVHWMVNRWATENGPRKVLARSHFQLHRVYRDLGDTAASLEHAVHSVELLDDESTVPARVYHLLALAYALAEAGSFDAARERYAQAERHTVLAGDVERQLLVLNNLADMELRADEPQRALTAVERLRAAAAVDGRALDTAATYLGTLAEVQIALGRYVDAERTARTALERFHAEAHEASHSLPYHLLTLAMAQRHLGALDEAQRSLDRCVALCRDRDLESLRAPTLHEQSELLAARGDFPRALATYKEFHAAEKRLISQQREAQARTRQAIFETAEARKDAERFREQARRDTLTGLRNRRYVDEYLPVLLEQSIATGAPLVAAFVDLDHFKRINDTLSHDVGDQVLVQVANLLAAAVPADVTGGGGFVARMGGEEFLIVLTQLAVGDALLRLEQLRGAIAAHDWRPVTGDLPVTVSIGAAAARPGSDRADLLNRADAHLYEAKRAGRNRLCAAR